MTPATLVRSAARKLSGGSTSNKPTQREIIDAMRAEGLTSQQAGELLAVFDKIQPLIQEHDLEGEGICRWIDNGDTAVTKAGFPYIAAIMLNYSDGRHASLDAIMVDLAVAAPGSAHDLLNRHFLAPNERFVHDFAGQCVIGVARST